ncbi:DNA repair protein complementing XP-C cells-like protein [Elysia marginata]|uniref:DNA repair protein complementing XP-C cells-like protein n=1 Tax=Elysia marginata TaxID=1093978 RepID=A0AAV4FVR2_9GAST|nr:DNA repair protein complementing XP-C cells-like protein [Elysia marginata]
MKSKVHSSTEKPVTKKRKGTVSTNGDLESSGPDVENSGEVTTKKIKKQREKASFCQKPMSAKCESNDRKTTAKVQGKKSVAPSKKKAVSNQSQVVEKKPDLVAGIEKRIRSSSSSLHSDSKEKKSCVSLSGNQQSTSSTRKRASADSNCSLTVTTNQLKVRKIQIDKRNILEKNEKFPSLSEQGGKQKRKPKIGSSSSLLLKKSAAQDEEAPIAPSAVDASDPMTMLMMMEGNSGSKSVRSSTDFASSESHAKPSTSTPRASSSKRLKKRQVSNSKHESSGSEGLSDWEDVHDHPDSTKKSQVPDGPVEITLDLPDILKHKKRKKKEFDWKLYLERRVRRFKKEVAMDIHKVLASVMEKCVTEGAINDARVWVLEEGKHGSSGKNQPKVSKVPSISQAKISKSTSSLSSKSSTSVSSKDKDQASKHKVTGNRKDTAVKRKSLSRASSELAKKKLRESEEESDDDDNKDDSKVKSKKGKMKVVRTSTKSKDKITKDEDDVDDHGSESDFEETSPYFSSPRHLRKDLKILSNRKILSPTTSDAEDVTINRSTIADGGVKDVTARYAKLWMSHTRKQRVDQDWWGESLGPFNTTPHAANMEEDDEIKGKLLNRPMPTSIADLKNHPLYALRRHLLKFEAIYPDTAIPLGYIKQEPIYARECVRTLHSRDNWLKEGRMVRLAEQPYKMVKSRPKWNRPKDNPDELDLELYGEWQTEKYIPPPAVNGKVPKNEYGNVELFKSWMLPLGTVQLKVNGLQRIARKLGIDVAPAMVGWDHHSGHSHPLFDGVIVCEEYADALMLAWTEDQEIQEQRETEKREKRVYGNWKLLIRGLLIKSRLAEKFSQVRFTFIL